MRHTATRPMIERLYKIRVELTEWESEFISVIFLRIAYGTLSTLTDNQTDTLERLFLKHFPKG